MSTRSQLDNAKRRGEVSWFLLLVLASILLVGLLLYAAIRLRPAASQHSSTKQSINIYCAAGIAKPVQDVLDKYNEEFGVNLKIVRTGGSGELAGQIKTEYETGVVDGADLYLTADQLLLEKAKSEGIIAEQFELALQRPVVAIRSNYDLNFEDFKSLVQSGKVKFGISSTRAAVGKLVRSIAARDGFLDDLEKNKVTDFENVMTLAQSLVSGSIDAALIWDTTVAQINQNSDDQQLLAIHCPADPRDEFRSNIGIGVLRTTEKATQCLKLARYLTATEKAESIFKSYGFSFLPGDKWSEVPEIHLFCGSMFTPVIEEVVREFAVREGVNLYPKWEGCGKLVTRMRVNNGEAKFPDAYFACDQMFLDQVKQHFQKPIVVSQNDIVIAVRKEVASDINSLNDLLDDQHDLRIGICDPEQSALGTLTKLMLNDTEDDRAYETLSQKSSVTVDVGPTLVSQLLAGGLDAAIVYRSNIMADEKTKNELRVVEVDRSIPFSVATQPWAISKTTPYPKLMGRLFEKIQDTESLQRFAELGFTVEHNKPN